MSRKTILRLVLWNLVIAAAFVYRWRLGAPVNLLAIAAIIIFPLVNVLILVTSRQSPRSR